MNTLETAPPTAEGKWTFAKMNEWNRLIREEDKVPLVRVAVANEMLHDLGQKPVSSIESANHILKALVQEWLDRDLYMQAAVFMLGRNYFDERSVLVKDIFESMSKYDRNSIPGGSSLSKTFSVVIWHAMDWLRDPENTAIRVTALSDTTLRNNIFNNLTHCFRSMIINYNLVYKNLYIGLNANDREGGIQGITYPQDSMETGRFKGFKPISRNGPPHPKFGVRTRVRLIMEEASNMSDGVRQELNSMESSIGDVDDGRVKLTAIFNPYNISHWTASLSAPEKGISSLDMDKDHQWESADGWHVTRLDGKRCENVVAKKVVIPCMMSYKKYKEFEAKGPASIDYSCYGRGFWPILGSHHLLIPRYQLEDRRCQPLFMSHVQNVGAVDTAIVEDNIVFSSARWSRCVGLTWPNGTREMFDEKNPHPHRKKPKHVLWAEPLIRIQLARRDTMIVAEAIAKTAKALNIEPQWLAIDSTGSGVGVYDWLRANYGGVLGIQWANKASEKRVLETSEQKPYDLYDRMSSEMWFATKEWLENDIIFFSPNFVDEPLFGQLTKRRLPLDEKSFRGRLRIETKADYKAHENGVSPDYADSFVMLQQIIRMRGDNIPGIALSANSKPRRNLASVHDTRETINGVLEPLEGPLPDPTGHEWMEQQAKRY